MRALACLVFIALAHAIRGNPDLYKGPLGSRDAPIGKFPYQVILRYEDISGPGVDKCGGSILNNRNILTSAYCINLDELDKLKAHVGTNFFTVPGDIYDVADVTIHEKYNETTEDYDIALIHLKTPIEYNKLVQPINLMTTDKDLFGNPCTLTGWGSRGAFNGVVIDSLQEVELIVWDNQEDLATTQFCALTGEKELALQYLFGSPLVANGNQIGILSSNGDPDELSAPTYESRLKIFTRVSDLKWISTNLKN
ncbi:chymotrypsin-1-like [Temnothorax curvispinosus]|uniref:Chymotrypsin-1-like n=1 Tax=Temnothorax curvispinosus TaxID=300111 RepID=A0A6J1QRU4_9HYME|nr:chymotrypsin-1-like [Temnothorax curvispinosus]